MGMPNYQRELKRALKPLGWRVRKRHSGGTHLIVTNEEHCFSVPLSPSCAEHAIRNTVRTIRNRY